MWSIIFCYAMVLSLLVTAIILFCNDLYYKIPVVDVDDFHITDFLENLEENTEETQTPPMLIVVEKTNNQNPKEEKQ